MSVVRNNKYKKSEHRQKEILKAQAKTFIRYNDHDLSKNVGNIAVSNMNIDKKINALNLKVIKSDLLKTSFYVLFVIIMVFLIKTLNLEFNLGVYK